MTAVLATSAASSARREPSRPEPFATESRLGRLGGWCAGHFRPVVISWLIVVIGLAAFAPTVESHLSGAGWQAGGSDSVTARSIIDRDFHGLSATSLQVVISSRTPIADTPAARSAVSRAEALLRADPRVSTVIGPEPGSTVSRDGRTAVITGGSGGNSTEMVRAADALGNPLRALSSPGVTVALTGDSALWSDFNHANLSAMLRSEVLSWPVTLAILVLAFGSLVAAGLPLMLTIAGLVASAGVLDLTARVEHVSVWAMNFALMFALALGIDYALFVVVRFRAALAGRQSEDLDSAPNPVAAAAEAIATAGKAVLFSGLTVLVSLSAVMLVPSPAFRSMAFGIMVSVVFVLAATLTLLPAVLARLGTKISAGALPFAQPTAGPSRRFGRWADTIERHPLVLGAGALAALVVLATPVIGLRTGMPSITVIPDTASARIGYDAVSTGFGPGAINQMQVVAPAGQSAPILRRLRADSRLAAVVPVGDSDGYALIEVIPLAAPSTLAADSTIDRVRAELPRGALLGGANVENHDLQRLLVAKTPLVITVVLSLGFLLLLIALQAPLVALLGVLTNLLAVGAAFGVGRLIFQDGHGAGILRFTPLGFLDAWAPVFFFAMIFAISMDYTLFLLSTAKEAWDRTGDPRAATRAALGNVGRVIFAAAAVMVAVFLTFALSGPLPPKEMGIVLGVAVGLDAVLVRLLLLPVLLRLTGRAAWWSPGWLRRVLPHVAIGH